nr:hypothetical protein [uncultured Desulfobulbus sp.]
MDQKSTGTQNTPPYTKLIWRGVRKTRLPDIASNFKDFKNEKNTYEQTVMPYA